MPLPPSQQRSPAVGASAAHAAPSAVCGMPGCRGSCRSGREPPLAKDCKIYMPKYSRKFPLEFDRLISFRTKFSEKFPMGNFQTKFPLNSKLKSDHSNNAIFRGRGSKSPSAAIIGAKLDDETEGREEGGSHNPVGPFSSFLAASTPAPFC